MLATDRDAVICDFAEYYGVLDLYRLPPVTAATLAQGLSKDSRIVRKQAGAGELDVATTLLAVIADRLGVIAWLNSKDGAEGVNRPRSILAILNGTETEDAGYATGDDFIKAWNAITGGEPSGD